MDKISKYDNILSAEAEQLAHFLALNGFRFGHVNLSIVSKINNVKVLQRQMPTASKVFSVEAIQC